MKIIFLFLTLVMLCAPHTSYAASATTKGGVKITDLSVTPQTHNVNYGGVLMRFRLENNSTVRRNVVCGITVNNINKNNMSLDKISGEIEIEPGASAEMSFPFYPGYSGLKTVFVDDGVSTCNMVLKDIIDFDSINIFLSNSMSLEALQDRVKNGNESLRMHFDNYQVRITKERDCVAPWQDDWRAYAQYGLIIVNASDYDRIPAATRQALKDYVMTGGRLIFSGMKSLPLDWINYDAFTTDKKTETNAMLKAYQFVKGEVFVLEEAGEHAFDKLSDDQIIHLFVTAPLNVQDAFNTQNIPILFPPADIINHTVPIRILLLLLTLFTVIAGPITVAVLARLNRRIWLLWVIPAFSTISVALIFILVICVDGILPRVSRSAVTYLMQNSGRAVTFGNLSIFTPFALRSDLNFDKTTCEVVPRKGGNGNKKITIGHTLDYASSWVSSRTSTHFVIRQACAESRRIDFLRNNGQLLAINMLGSKISKLWVHDENGQVFFASSVDSGAKALLQKCGQTDVNSYVASTKIEICNTPLTYCAELDSACPFFDDPLSSISKMCTEAAVVYGTFSIKNGSAAK